MGNLSNLYISQSFISLIHLGSDTSITTASVQLQDGLGNGTGVFVNSLGDVSLSGSLTASLAKGYVWVGNGSNRTTLVATSSFSGGGTTNTGSLLVTASAAGANITFTKGDASQFTIQVATGSTVSASYAEYAETSSITRNVVVVARNGNPSTLAAGTVVHITSAVGDNPVFTTASYADEALSGNTFGLLRNSSVSGADVEVVVSGIVTGVNTDPALGYTAGDILYLSSSGQFTRVQPQAPNQIVTLGQVLRAQQNNGSIYISINNGWELNELHNVQITNPVTNNLLAYESASYGLWKNKTYSQLGLATTGSNTFSGSQNITGSINVHSGSYNGQAITNITPISSSQSAVKNIVTLTATEYGLITPQATTLYIVI